MFREEDLTQEDLEYLDKHCTPENFRKLVLALGFYADGDSYFAIGILPDRPCGEFADDFSEIKFLDEDNPETVLYTETRPGKRARETFMEIFKEKP